MRLNALLLCSVPAVFLAATAAVADEPSGVQKRLNDAIAQSQKTRPCGEYENAGSSYPRIVFGDGHKVWVNLGSERKEGELNDRRLRTWIPVNGQVKVINDKGHFDFTLESPDTLKGMDEWTKGGTWKRTRKPKKACTPLGATPEERKVLTATLCEVDVVTLQREAKLDQALAAAKECCFTSGAMVSCDRAGQLIDLRNFTKPRGSDGAKALYEKACNADVARGCLNLGHVAKDAGQEDAARDLYKKACALGLPDGCIEEIQL